MTPNITPEQANDPFALPEVECVTGFSAALDNYICMMRQIVDEVNVINPDQMARLQKMTVAEYYQRLDSNLETVRNLGYPYAEKAVRLRDACVRMADQFQEIAKLSLEAIKRVTERAEVMKLEKQYYDAS